MNASSAALFEKFNKLKISAGNHSPSLTTLKAEMPEIEILYPNGVGPKAQNLETFRASVVKWLKVSHEYSQLESIVRTGKYVSIRNRPREPIKVRNLLPIKPEYGQFDFDRSPDV